MNIHPALFILPYMAMMSVGAAVSGEAPLPDQSKETSVQEGPGTDGAESSRPGVVQQGGQRGDLKSSGSGMQRPCDEDTKSSSSDGSGEEKADPGSGGGGY